MIWEVPGIWIAWLILHVIVNNSTSIVVTLLVWWRVFFNKLLNKWMWAIDMVMLFLMLTLETMMTVDGSGDVFSIILLRQLKWWDLLSSKLWLALWKKKQLQKELINLFPRWNSVLRGLKDRNISLRWLLALIMKLLMTAYCLDVMCSKEK